MGSHVGMNFLNTLLGGLAQGAQSDPNLVVKTTSEVRMADPNRVAFALEILPAGESSQPPPIAGTRQLPPIESKETEEPEEMEEADEAPEPVRTGVLAGVRMPAATVASVPSSTPMAGSRVDAATRQAHDYSPVESESPELVPSTPSTVIDYNPEYQNQFDRYLRTRAFDRMFGSALRGVGAPEPRTPAY